MPNKLPKKYLLSPTDIVSFALNKIIRQRINHLYDFHKFSLFGLPEARFTPEPKTANAAFSFLLSHNHQLVTLTRESLSHIQRHCPMIYFCLLQGKNP
jgi:hypothetical protein